MSKLLEIQQNILETNAALADLEKAAIEEPESTSLGITADSLRKRYKGLEEEFMIEAGRIGIDVCSYRLFSEEETPTLKGLTSVLGDFQNLVTTVYDAVKTAVPKVRARVSSEIVAESEFRLGYTFPGSVGVVLTIQNQRSLFGDSPLDESLRQIAEMTKVQDSESVLGFSKKLGAASIRALYRWAYDHAESGMGVDLEWRRERLVRTKFFTQRPEFRRLEETINRTSEESITKVTEYGDLVGADVSRKTFHLKLDSGVEIRGSFSEAISESQTVELPKRYRVQLVRNQRIFYSTEQEIVTYYLEKLEPIYLKEGFRQE